MVAQLGPLEYLVTGFDASVSFRLADTAGKAQNQQLEILRAEEGRYVNGSWQALRIWNGDQTDRGLNFKGSHPEVVRIRLHTIDLYDRSVARPGSELGAGIADPGVHWIWIRVRYGGSMG